jgi:hypothetical protein
MLARRPLKENDHYAYSAAAEEARVMAVPAHEAAGWLTGKPSFDIEPDWPMCEGVCLQGHCALRWGTPACCYVHPRGDYDYYDQYHDGHHTNEGYHGEREDAYDTSRRDDYYRTGEGYARGRPYGDASEAVETTRVGYKGGKEWFCWGK